MLSVLVKRLGATVVLLAIVSVLAFVLSRAGTDPVEALSYGVDESGKAAIEERFGREGSLPEQYVTYMSRAVRGDLGPAMMTDERITDTIRRRIGVTLTIAFSGLLVATAIGFSLGIVAAWRSGTWLDRVIRVFGSVALATPPFWFGSVLILVLAVRNKWLPATGWTRFSDSPAQWLRGLVLPALAVSLFGIATIMRATRTAATQIFSQDFIRSARVKGLTIWQTIRKHVVRNVLAQIVPILGLQFVVLFGTSVFVESLLAIPGLGFPIVNAANQGDAGVIQGIAMVAAIVVAVVNLISDIAQSALNPKVRA
jgi:peptide/nickel transport system permease protein